MRYPVPVPYESLCVLELPGHELSSGGAGHHRGHGEVAAGGVRLGGSYVTLLRFQVSVGENEQQKKVKSVNFKVH